MISATAVINLRNLSESIASDNSSTYQNLLSGTALFHTRRNLSYHPYGY